MYHMGYVMAGAPPRTGYVLGDAGTNDTSPTRFDLDYWYERIQYELRHEPSPNREFWTAHDLAKHLHKWVMDTLQLPTPSPVTHPEGIEYDWWVTTLAPLLHTAESSGTGTDITRMTPWVNALIDINTTLREIELQLEDAVDNGWEIVPGTRSEEWTLQIVEWTRQVARVGAAIEEGIDKGNAAAVAEARRYADEIGAGQDGLALYGHTIERMYKNVEEGAKTHVVEPVMQAVKNAKEELKETVKQVGWMDIAKIAVPLGLGIVLLHKMR